MKSVSVFSVVSEYQLCKTCKSITCNSCNKRPFVMYDFWQTMDFYAAVRNWKLHTLRVIYIDANVYQYPKVLVIIFNEWNRCLENVEIPLSTRVTRVDVQKSEFNRHSSFNRANYLQSAMLERRFVIFMKVTLVRSSSVYIIYRPIVQPCTVFFFPTGFVDFPFSRLC